MLGFGLLLLSSNAPILPDWDAWGRAGCVVHTKETEMWLAFGRFSKARCVTCVTDGVMTGVTGPSRVCEFVKDSELTDTYQNWLLMRIWMPINFMALILLKMLQKCNVFACHY